MLPFMPPPPNCAARPVHVDGNATWKFIGLAVGSRSTGAIEPVTVQYGERPLAASTHRGASSVTADTGSPIAEILEPEDSALYADQAVMLVGSAYDSDTNDPLAYKWEVVVGGVHTTLKIGTTQANQQFTREFKPSLYFAPLTCGTKKATIVLTVTDSSGIKFEVSREYYILFGPC